MLGALIGDIIGSRFEFISTQEKDIQLFHSACSWTDDSVCTSAVAIVCEQIKANHIKDNDKIEQLFFKQFKKSVNDHPMAGYGKKFYEWSQNKTYSMGDSAANGCLMRVSPIAFYFDDLETILKIGQLCTKVSHNHEDSYRSVNAYLEILFLLRTNKKEKSLFDLKEPIIEICQKYNFLIESLEYYHKTAGYWVLAKDTLPRAIAAFFASTNFLSTFSNIIYLGSDTDTTATIAGSMAELLYGVDSKNLQNLYRYFDHKSFDIVHSVCHPYILHEQEVKQMYGNETYQKIDELFKYTPTDPTAAYDPLELPNDDEYYKGKMPPLSLKEKFLKLFK